MAGERVLVVDSDTIEGQVTAYILSEQGKYPVSLAVSGFEALEMIDALEAMQSDGFDLVVLDIRLSGDLDGITLAERIWARPSEYPKPSIMAVTAENDMAVLRRCALKGIIVYILKPYLPRLLLGRAEEVLSERCDRRSAKEGEQKRDMFEILNGIMELPTLPEVLTRIHDLSEDSDVTAEEFGTTISLDLSIASKVLRMANSAFFGIRREITSVKDAITLLGFETVRNVALVTASFEILKGRPGTGHFDRLAFWQHSMGCGAIAKVLCQQVGIDREDYFTAGVMHDMGRVILDAFFPRLFSTVLETASDGHMSLREAEKKALGITHAEIGKCVAERWDLPVGLEEAIAYHHTPEEAKTDAQLVSLIHLADVICHQLMVGSGGDHFVPEMDDFACDNLGLSEATMERYIPAMQQEIRNAFDVMPLGNIGRK